MSDQELQALGHRPQSRASLRATAGHRMGGGSSQRPNSAAAEPSGNGLVCEGSRSGRSGGCRSLGACLVDFWRPPVTLTAADVAEILRLVEDSGFDELNLENRRHRRSACGAGEQVLHRRPSQAGRVESAEPSRRLLSAPGNRAGTGGCGGRRCDQRGSEVQAVASPMLGTFYRAPKPGAPPFVRWARRSRKTPSWASSR